MNFNTEEIMALLTDFIEKHPLIIDYGGEYIVRNWRMQNAALQLLCDIFDNMRSRQEK